MSQTPKVDAAAESASIEKIIRERLAHLKPERLELIDDSALHAGHEGAKSGAHYRLFVVSSAFAEKSAVARHRLVYGALDDLMKTRIHALSIRLMTPEEGQ